MSDISPRKIENTTSNHCSHNFGKKVLNS